MLRIGFTGTRQGMTAGQERVLRSLLTSHTGAVLHHGDCIGADAQAHDVAVSLGLDVVIHPPLVETQRAWKKALHVRKPRPYLERNKDIVRETEMVIATPAEAFEQLRSGTWSTVRFARKQGRAIWIIQPEGIVIPGAAQTAQEAEERKAAESEKDRLFRSLFEIKYPMAPD
jgi:hypothetical protein